MKNAKDWTYDGSYLATVESETYPGKTYDIRRTREQLTCDCARYRFSHAPKSCKHLEAYLAGEAAEAKANRLVPAPRVVVESAGETFTVTRRRGISFDGSLR